MIEMREGVTDALTAMTYHAFWQMLDYRLRMIDQKMTFSQLSQRLNSHEWVVGFYKGDLCLAALWGDNEIYMIAHPDHRRTVFKRDSIKRFFTYFFHRHAVAIVEGNNPYLTKLWGKLGFKEHDGKLILTREAYHA